MARMGKRPKSEKYEQAVKLLNEGKKVGAYPSIRTAETVISYASSIEEGMALVTAFGKRGVVPNSKILGLMLNLAKNKTEALSLVKKFEIEGVKLDVYGLNRLVSLCESEKEAVPILNYYHSIGLKPSTATIAALIKVSSTIQYADTVIKKSFDSRIVKPDNYVLNARLTLCQTLDEMNYITEEMKRAYGLEADAISSSIKIKKALDEKNYDFAEVELVKAQKFPKLSGKTNTILKRYHNSLQRIRRKQEAALKPSPEDFTGEGIFEVPTDTPTNQNKKPDEPEGVLA